jgi:hypothetical protein
MGVLRGMAMFRNNMLFPLIESVIQRLIDAGITQQLEKFHMEYEKRRLLMQAPKKVEELKSFTVEDLSYGFEIWIITTAISLIVFCCEIIPEVAIILWKEFRNLVGLIFALNFLRGYVEKMK